MDKVTWSTVNDRKSMTGALLGKKKQQQQHVKLSISVDGAEWNFILEPEHQDEFKEFLVLSPKRYRVHSDFASLHEIDTSVPRVQVWGGTGTLCGVFVMVGGVVRR